MSGPFANPESKRQNAVEDSWIKWTGVKEQVHAGVEASDVV
jgi:hypothetical protein